MTDRDRFKLLYGPYRTPRFKLGDVVFCEMRGEVKIVGLRDCDVTTRQAAAATRHRRLGAITSWQAIE
jgi:hypothetical protein